jgi:hypothetical protein
MKVYPGSLLALASLMLSGTALAQDASASPCASAGWSCWSPSTGQDWRPSNGNGALASGGALTVIGGLLFATAPLCKSKIVNAPEQGSCFTASFMVGTPLVALGIPLIVFGAVQRVKYDEWARKHPTLTGLSFSPGSGGGAVGWSGSF